MTLLKTPGTPAPPRGQSLLEPAAGPIGLTEDQTLLPPLLPAYRPPQSIAAVGIPENFLANLLVKHAFYLEVFTLPDMTQRLKLNSALVMHLLDYLRREKYVEVKGSASLNGAVTAISQNYRYALTEGGKRRAAQLFEFDTYIGPAPVTLEDYWEQVEGQTIREHRVRPEQLAAAFDGLILAPDFLQRLGPALLSGKPIFIYGPPGNGKTAISLRLGAVFDEPIMVPYALYVEGNVIRLFDEVTHRPLAEQDGDLFKTDPRWVRCHRPAVIVGGEMTLEMLDLTFNPILKYYEAPLQMKANNGLFVIDDFGRQRIAPQELLNRWIIPMENHRDFLCLHTGQKFAIPFDQLLIFSTNLEPESLMDPAFLRRLRYKIKLDHISRDQFLAIFRLVCAEYGLAYRQEVVDYLLEHYYDPVGRPLDACHPRDLVEQILDAARFQEVPPELTLETIDRACQVYFVD